MRIIGYCIRYESPYRPDVIDSLPDTLYNVRTELHHFSVQYRESLLYRSLVFTSFEAARTAEAFCNRHSAIQDPRFTVVTLVDRLPDAA